MIVGIDLGTTNSLAALWRNGQAELVPNALGKFLTPSAVSMDEDGSILVGEPARDRAQTHPAHTATAFKRAMGTGQKFRLGKQSFRAEDLSALVLRSLKADAESLFGGDIDQAVITVPAYFSDSQRHATRAAGSMAGFSKVTLLNEPTAAALAYGLHQEKSETQFLVFDLGGGTFDVSVLELFEGVMEVRSTAGDNQLGGEDLDAIVARHFADVSGLSVAMETDAMLAARIRASAEAAKCSLADGGAVTMSLIHDGKKYSQDLTITQLESLAQPLLERLRQPVERALRDARIRAGELDAVVLAGGSTRLHAVRQLVTRMFARFPETALDPDQVVAMGAAVQGGLIIRDSALGERVMTDVCPYTLGLEASREMSQGRFSPGFYAPVLDRNTPIPASRVQRFSPLVDFQTNLILNIYQGEARLVRDNIKLGQITLKLPPAKLGQVAADVRFTYDASGLLEVEATVVKDEMPVGATARLVIESSGDRLSADDINSRLAALGELKIHPRDRLETRALLARAERHYAQSLGMQREHLGVVIQQFEVALETQDDRRIQPLRRHLSDLLAAVENDGFFPETGL
ncbi:MAG: molecular chaperone HscC [Ramlibacter sp.]|nr:molecular chaperone HscC [Ramlibacter sp.]